MDLVDVLFETVDFFEECQEKNSCEFSDCLSDYRSKFSKFIYDCTMARSDLNFAKNGFKNELTFRNKYFIRKI